MLNRHLYSGWFLIVLIFLFASGCKKEKDSPAQPVQQDFIDSLVVYDTKNNIRTVERYYYNAQDQISDFSVTTYRNGSIGWWWRVVLAYNPDGSLATATTKFNNNPTSETTIRYTYQNGLLAKREATESTTQVDDFTRYSYEQGRTKSLIQKYISTSFGEYQQDSILYFYLGNQITHDSTFRQEYQPGPRGYQFAATSQYQFDTKGRLQRRKFDNGSLDFYYSDLIEDDAAIRNSLDMLTILRPNILFTNYTLLPYEVVKKLGTASILVYNGGSNSTSVDQPYANPYSTSVKTTLIGRTYTITNTSDPRHYFELVVRKR